MRRRVVHTYYYFWYFLTFTPPPPEQQLPPTTRGSPHRPPFPSSVVIHSQQQSITRKLDLSCPVGRSRRPVRFRSTLATVWFPLTDILSFSTNEFTTSLALSSPKRLQSYSSLDSLLIYHRSQILQLYFPEGTKRKSSSLSQKDHHPITPSGTSRTKKKEGTKERREEDIIIFTVTVSQLE